MVPLGVLLNEFIHEHVLNKAKDMYEKTPRQRGYIDSTQRTFVFNTLN